MPYRDGSGPAGMGAMTGRRLGSCAGNRVPGQFNGGYGRGCGPGHHRGFGLGCGYYHRPYRPPVQTEEGEKEYLKSMAQSLEGELKVIQERLNQLAKEQE